MKKLLLMMIFVPSICFASQIGDVRETPYGNEQCIYVQGDIEAWALVETSDEYKAKIKSDSDRQQAQEDTMKVQAKERSDALDELIQERIQAKKKK